MELSGTFYTCSAGETFDLIALYLYGNEKYAVDLMQANPALCTRCRFAGGEVLNLPVIAIPESSSETAAIPVNAPWKEG